MHCVRRVRVYLDQLPRRIAVPDFDIIEMDATLNIFRRLPLRDLLCITIAVCKGWRSLRNRSAAIANLVHICALV